MSNFTFRIGETEDGKAVQMDLPTLIETRLFDLASSGGGKSYALRVLIEKTAEHVQWIIIDPEGEFASLREKFDFLLVGKDGEVPVDARSAKLLARKIMETRASVIVDLYGLAELGITWVANFLPELMALPKDLWSPVIVAIDEAHKYARETTKGKETEPPAVARKAVITLSDSGRKQSRGCVIATQRLSKLAADARAELRNNLIGLTIQDIDRDRAADILGIPKRQSEVLRELNAGEFFAFGPAFISHKGVFKLKIDPALTRHPKPGEGRLLAVPKASDAIRLIVSDLGDLPVQAEAEIKDLQFLRTENVRLEREIRLRSAETTGTKIQYIEKPVLNGELKNLEAAIQGMNGFAAEQAAFGNKVLEMGALVARGAREISSAILAFQRDTPRWKALGKATGDTPPDNPKPSPTLSGDAVKQWRNAHNLSADSLAGALGYTRSYIKGIEGGSQVASQKFWEKFKEFRLEVEYGSKFAAPRLEKLPVPMQRILDTLLQFEELGIGSAQKSNIAVFSDQSPKSSGYHNNLGRLRALGFIEYPESNYVRITPEGRERAHPAEHISTLRDLHAAWFARLPRPRSAILQILITEYPQEVSKDALAQRAEQSPTSSGYHNNLGGLRSLGLVDYPHSGYVRATSLLFPNGLI